MPTSNPNTVIDDLDEAIIAEFQYDGRQSNREVARKLNVSEGAVRQRLKRLQEKKIVAFNLLIDTASSGNHFGAIFRVNVAPNQMERLLKSAEKIDEVTYLVECAGRYNVAGFISTRDQRSALKLIDQHFLTAKGVNSVDVIQLAQQIKHNFLETVIAEERSHSESESSL
ncbi:MAG: Lrp/AsnC family transcriptional regulator [Chloroflexota bacterium]|nr:Lrp/AsnC family transcriptional regulator [Chloroflexota bacterium]